MRRKVVVCDLMQQGYTYYCTEPVGKHFHAEFRPELTPEQMLALGVFGGKYMTDCADEFPREWFQRAKLSPEGRNKELNFFKVNASLPLRVWQEKGWIYHEDPRGWFQWYCRYYMGRRILEEDERQIKRWKAITRHVGAIKKNCRKGDFTCRPKQRQTLLHWAYDGRKV